MIVVRWRDECKQRQAVWRPVPEPDPQRPNLHLALLYGDNTPGLLYGHLTRLEAGVWQLPDGQWVGQVGAHVTNGDNGHAVALLPQGNPVEAQSLARVDAEYAARQWLMLPTLNGVEWVGPPLGPEHVPVVLAPAAHQALAWLRQRVGGDDNTLIGDAVALYQALEEQHQRGRELHVRVPAQCGHSEYEPYRYIVGDRAWRNGVASGAV